jgi:hypothetical protein
VTQERGPSIERETEKSRSLLEPFGDLLIYSHLPPSLARQSAGSMDTALLRLASKRSHPAAC